MQTLTKPKLRRRFRKKIFLFNKTQMKNAFKQQEINMFSKIIFQLTTELGKRTGIE
jgi:hypothetical protein